MMKLAVGGGEREGREGERREGEREKGRRERGREGGREMIIPHL